MGSMQRHAVVTMLILAGTTSMMASSVVLAATGCTTSTKSCRVDTRVSGTSASYAVTFTPDALHVKQNQLGKRYKITFHIRTRGFVCQDSDGIEFKDPTGNEFACAKVKLSKKQWKCTYENQVLGK